MSRPSTMEILERAHKLAASSLGDVALATVTSRAKASFIRRAVSNFREAADLLEQLLPRSSENGEGRQ